MHTYICRYIYMCIFLGSCMHAYIHLQIYYIYVSIELLYSWGHVTWSQTRYHTLKKRKKNTYCIICTCILLGSRDMVTVQPRTQKRKKKRTKYLRYYMYVLFLGSRDMVTVQPRTQKRKKKEKIPRTKSCPCLWYVCVCVCNTYVCVYVLYVCIYVHT